MQTIFNMAENTKERDALAKEYDVIHNRLFLVEFVVMAVLLGFYLFSGASAALAHGLGVRFGESHWFVTNVVYTLITVFGFTACMFPLSYYSGHVLEQYYELSHESFGDWLSYFFKSMGVDLLLATVLFSVTYALLRWIPAWWWLAAAVFYIFFAVVLSTIFPIYIMPLFQKFEPLEEGDLSVAVRKMLAVANIPVVGAFKWGLEDKTATASATFTGMGRTRRIILGETLLTSYSQSEILAILAHEVGHYKNRDTARLMVTSSVLALAGFFIAHLCLSALTGLFGFAHIYDIGAAPIFIFSLLIFSLVSMPIANLHSRRREFAADAYAVEAMGSPDALISAFEKQGEQNLFNREPAVWVEFLLHSHPSISRRIQRVRNL